MVIELHVGEILQYLKHFIVFTITVEEKTWRMAVDETSNTCSFDLYSDIIEDNFQERESSYTEVSIVFDVLCNK